jgi:ribosomal protein S18 acetylase RimI-like enzyme
VDLLPGSAIRQRSEVVNLLTQVVWHSLTGAHRAFSSGTDTIRRYAKGFSPIIGYATPEQPDFAGIEPYCDEGEHLYCGGWKGAVPAGWKLEEDSAAGQMVWAGDRLPEADFQRCVRLGPQHVPQIVALVALTNPGPFGERTIELGEYFGIFEGPRLVAVAGERFKVGELREISAVCTHPEFQGRGLARTLVSHLINRQSHRRETPFLHVMVDNAPARSLYQRLGFNWIQELPVRVVTRGAG